VDTKTETLDTTGLNCPLPVLKAKKAIKTLNAGDTLVVLATDPASKIDFGHYCHVSGNEMRSQSELDGIFTYTIHIN
jgi:tRNA 2-thiouridine synthesizing protein A